MLADECKVESKQDVQRFAIQRAEVKVVRSQFKDMLMLLIHHLQGRRVDVAAADAARFERDPAVAALLSIFFEDELPIFTAIEVGHLRLGLTKAVEEVQDGFAARR